MKKLVLSLMMFAMKWLNRIISAPVRTLVRYVGANEVIACGLMDESNQTMVIYSPQMQRDHRIGSWEKNRFTERSTGDAAPFVGQLVLRAPTLDARKGEVFRIIAQHNSKDRQVHSPDIVMKMVTDYRNEFLKSRKTSEGMQLHWEKIPGEYATLSTF